MKKLILIPLALFVATLSGCLPGWGIARAEECTHHKTTGGMYLSAKVYKEAYSESLEHKCGPQVTYRDWICSICLEEGTERIEWHAGRCPGEPTEYEQLQWKKFLRDSRVPIKK